MEEQENAPLIVLRGLEGNQPTHLKGLQVYLAPYLNELVLFWWVVFFCTLFVVVGIVLKKFLVDRGSV